MSPSIPTASVIEDSRLRPLSDAEKRRYHRNMLVPEVGVLGQQRIRAARVLVVGLGALGSPAALYLAAAGVGTLGLVDADTVEVSNLQRQIIHTTSAQGQRKTDSARQALGALNPDVELQVFNERLTSANALELLRGWDVVVDGTDNFPTRYLLGDATAMLGIPLVHGAVLRSHGQVSVFDAQRGPCYRCLHPAPPEPGAVPSCAEAGVLGVLPGIIGSMQATEALKLIVGGGRPLIGRVLLLDAWGATVNEIAVAQNPDCALCGARPTVTELIDYESFCGLTSAQAPAITGVPTSSGTAAGSTADAVATITAAELRDQLAGSEPPALLDVREDVEVELEPMTGARHIPLGQVLGRMAELEPGRRTVVVCAAGVRSRRAVEALQAAGYAGELASLEGGVRAWSRSG